MATRLTPAERAYRQITEAQMQAKVLTHARMCGWMAVHFHDSRRQVARRDGRPVFVGDKDATGFPDTVLVRGKELLFVELKKELGKVESEQEEWLEALRNVPGVEVYVWRPSDWEEIHARLSRPKRNPRLDKILGPTPSNLTRPR